MVLEILIFNYYKQDIKIIIKTDSSNYMNNSILSQLDDNDLLQLIVFF